MCNVLWEINLSVQTELAGSVAADGMVALDPPTLGELKCMICLGNPRSSYLPMEPAGSAAIIGQLVWSLGSTPTVRAAMCYDSIRNRTVSMCRTHDNPDSMFSMSRQDLDRLISREID